MKTITLPAGTEYVRYDEIAHLVALAMWPLRDDDSPGDGMNYGYASVTLGRELAQAVEAEDIRIKDPLTLGSYKNHPGGARLEDALVRVDDLRQYLADRGIGVEVDAPAPTQTPAPELAEHNYSLLATRAELLDAFSKWGMAAAWFDDLNSRQWLLDARRKKGQGQRGHVIEPLFCPFAVMKGLIGSVRKAKRLQPDTAWRTLAHKFPKVYAEFSEYDPRELTGD